MTNIDGDEKSGADREEMRARLEKLWIRAAAAGGLRRKGKVCGMTEPYWDPFDKTIDIDPYPIWRRMREEQPVYRSAEVIEV
jgi:hypothetical protein